jgi:primosomal protein N' (replication factor Y)
VDATAPEHRASPFAPRPEQAVALAALNAAQATNAYKGFLLWGVTGSGKTEVYLAAIQETLARQKTAIVLVPEIGLTPQLEARFRARFGDDVVTIHSGLSVKARRAAWARVQAGAARVVVGPRSALFAPLTNLGMVIVDEEHDDSYKQDETPRYHARDLALVRAQLASAVCVLGSATPSLETLHNVASGKLHELVMRERATGGELPAVEIVRIGKQRDEDAPPERHVDQTGRHVRLFTPRLTELVQQTVERQEQVILFLNRRGFAPFVVCQGCGHGFKCEQCSVSLTHHMHSQTLRCHYCGHEERTPMSCPQCNSPELRVMGTGTERLEIELKRFFPTYRVGRLDRDVAHDAVTLAETLQRFRDGALDILVGTQMVTKGHDFPRVTLVGVLVADASLNFPDFRAAERTAQLLVQVAGRSGRADRPGRVVVQTFHPEHPALVAAASHDYAAFAQEELVERQALGYPPYLRVILLRLEHADPARVNADAKALAEAIRRAGTEAELLGPAPCALARLRGDYRVMILLKCKKPQVTKIGLQRALVEWRGEAKLTIDVDPVSML